MPTVSVILLAAGAGTRMKSRTPKAFLELAGRPLYEHSLATLRSVRDIKEVVIVVPPSLARNGFVAGGRRRQDSVLNGLKAVTGDLVLIHDAARPFLTRDVVRRVIAGAARYGAVLAAIPARDTVKRVAGDRVVETPDRSSIWQAQTPQGFRTKLLRAAYGAGHGRKDATDDAQIVERAGHPVRVVEGDVRNFKITSSGDLRLAEYISTQ